MSEKQVIKKEEIKTTLEGVVCTNPGKHIAPVYKRVYDSDLKKNVVKKVDETDLFEFIQASASSTDLAVLQQRFIALGEIPSVDPTMGSNDLSIFPSNIHEVYNMVNNIDANFKALPESIQKIFGDSQSYMNALMNGTYQATLMNALKPKPEEKKEGNENE